MIFRWALIIGIAVGLPVSVRADWPHVRGPRYDGVSEETGLAASWPEGGPAPLWSRSLGKGHSGIIVAEGRLFTHYQTVSGQYLLCINPATGERFWETRYDSAWQHLGPYPGPYATPTFDQGRVYFASPSGLVGCVDARDGTIRWSLDVHERFGGRGRSFGFAATPLVDDGRVYLPVGGRKAGLVALDAADGSTVWTVSDDPASYCPALAISWNGRRIIVGYMENSLLLVAAADGALVARMPLSTGYDEHSAWPLYREPDLALTSPFRAPARRLRLGSVESGAIALKESWSSPSLSNDVVSSVLLGDSVYGFDLKQMQSSAHRRSRGVFRRLDWESGKVRWSTDRVGHASVVAADDKLFLLTDGGEAIVARTNTPEYEELGRVQAFSDEICWTPPTVWRGRLFIRSPSRLLCYDIAAERIAPLGEAAEPIASSSWRFDPSWLLAREREYPNDAPTLDELRLWLGTSFVLLGLAAIAAIAVHVASKQVSARETSIVGVMLTFAFALGAVGPNLLSAAFDCCLFAWPLSVFVVCHAAVRAAVLKSHGGRLWIAALAVTCLAYFAACRAVGMSIGWYFLMGLPAAFLLSTFSAVVERRQYPVPAGILLLASLTAMMAAGQMFLLWNAAVGH